ncbi:hypothetical protein L1049_022217 [Liquidambar formosana]|uniref:Uncharacterized protein n=1 Tax=Liquidambar formosana TaxID=63359 RepID=A0AAP0WQW0_LIQFO
MLWKCTILAIFGYGGWKGMRGFLKIKREEVSFLWHKVVFLASFWELASLKFSAFHYLLSLLIGGQFEALSDVFELSILFSFPLQFVGPLHLFCIFPLYFLIKFYISC